MINEVNSVGAGSPATVQTSLIMINFYLYIACKCLATESVILVHNGLWHATEDGSQRKVSARRYFYSWIKLFIYHLRQKNIKVMKIIVKSHLDWELFEWTCGFCSWCRIFLKNEIQQRSSSSFLNWASALKKTCGWITLIFSIRLLQAKMFTKFLDLCLINAQKTSNQW